MKIKSNRTVSLQEVYSTVKQQFSQFEVTIEKNPIMGFEYILVKKSGALGAFIRVKDDSLTVDGAIPSFGIRFLLIFSGWIFFFIYIMKAKNQIARPVSDFLNDTYVLNIAPLGNSIPLQNNFSENQFQSTQTNQFQTSQTEEEIPAFLKIIPIVGIFLFSYFLITQIISLGSYGFNGYSLFYIFIYIACIVSQIILIQKKKIGFYIYSGSIGLKLLIGFVLYGMYLFYGLGLLFLLIEIGLGVVYAMNLKYFK